MTWIDLPESLRIDEVGDETTLVTLSFSLARCATLTPAELEVARCAAAGMSNEEIAHWRRTSVRTVANQIARVLQKLRRGSRSDLATIPELFA